MARKRKSNEAEGTSDDSFNIMFISLNLILLSFFILLNSLSVRDSSRTRKALGSLLGAFGILDGGHSASKDGDSMLPTDVMLIKKKTKTLLEQELRVMLRQLKKAAGKSPIGMIHTSDGIEVNLAEKILFRSGRLDINPEFFGLLDRIAKIIKKSGKAISVRGYTDPSPPGRFPSNLALSGSRAVRVARYLVEAGGISPNLVYADGYGAVPSVKGAQRYVKVVVPNSSLSRPLTAREED